MKSLLPILIVMMVLLLMIGSYVGAYLALGSRFDWRTPSGVTGTIERTYTHEWAITLFAPAAWTETKLRGVRVQAILVSPEYQQRLQN